MADIQVNLVDQHHRSEKSHVIATRLRPALQAIAKRMDSGANLKVVEVPPGPPVLAPIVAQIYGPDDAGRRKVAQQVRAVFEETTGVVDVDDSSIVNAPRKILLVDTSKAALQGVTQTAIVQTLRTGLTGDAATYLHEGSKYPLALNLHLAVADQGNLDTLLALGVKNNKGGIVPIRELVSISDTLREQPIYHKDGVALNYVVADMAGKVDSPLYGMFKMRSKIAEIAKTIPGGKLDEYFISTPNDTYRTYSLKWDGEWQVTYEPSAIWAQRMR